MTLDLITTEDLEEHAWPTPEGTALILLSIGF